MQILNFCNVDVPALMSQVDDSSSFMQLAITFKQLESGSGGGVVVGAKSVREKADEMVHGKLCNERERKKKKSHENSDMNSIIVKRETAAKLNWQRC